MDRPLDERHVRDTRRRRNLLAAAAVLGLLALAWAPRWLTPSVERARIRTSVVDEGPVASVLTASGLVVPEHEQVVASPVDARVLRILRRPGVSLAKGDPILELDLGTARLAAATLEQKVALKAVEDRRSAIDLAATLADVEGGLEIKQLQMEAARAHAGRLKELFEQGLISREELTQAELGEKQATVERRKLEAQARHARETADAQRQGRELEMAILRQERQLAREQVDLGTTRTDRPGVLTWVTPEEGALVRRGDVLARVADLSRFRVDATLSDVHARQVREGQPVQVRTGGEVLEGEVARVDPSVREGALTIGVRLGQPDSPLLKASLRVDVDVLSERRPRALRLERGPGLVGSGAQEVFVVRGGRAVRTAVRLGLLGLDRVEVVSGLEKGDEVIVSETRAWAQAREVRIR